MEASSPAKSDITRRCQIFDDLEIVLDLDEVHRSVDRVRVVLIDLRRRYNLAPFEYTKRVRIAPLEIPHSHPIITLNTWVRDELGLLCTYLHEQVHWYLTWYSHTQPHKCEAVFQALRGRYSNAPLDASDAARSRRR